MIAELGDQSQLATMLCAIDKAVSISLALMPSGQVVLGVVYDPLHDAWREWLMRMGMAKG
ncbi:MAG: hypothetical protein P8163_21230 [Candidatus Thiodiazotropha sp.]